MIRNWVEEGLMAGIKHEHKTSKAANIPTPTKLANHKMKWQQIHCWFLSAQKLSNAAPANVWVEGSEKKRTWLKLFDLLRIRIQVLLQLAY